MGLDWLGGNGGIAGRGLYDGVRWRWRVLSEFERVGWWSDDPELPLPLPECWLPTIVSEDADADGDLCHGG